MNGFCAWNPFLLFMAQTNVSTKVRNKLHFHYKCNGYPTKLYQNSFHAAPNCTEIMSRRLKKTS